MLHRTDPHLPSKKVAGTCHPVLEKAAKIPCFTSGPQQPATEWREGRENPTGRGLQVRSSPLSHRHPCLTQPWPESTGISARPGFIQWCLWWAGYSELHCVLVPTFRNMDRWEICWAALAECGMDWNVPRDDSGAIGCRPPTGVTRYLARKRTPALCACGKGCDRDATSRCKEPSTSSARLTHAHGRRNQARRADAAENHPIAVVIPFPHRRSHHEHPPRCISSAEAARCPPHCNLTPGASGVDKSGGRAGVQLPSPARLLGPDDSCMASAASVAWCRGE